MLYVSADPFVAGLSTDAVPAARLGNGNEVSDAIGEEKHLLVHG